MDPASHRIQGKLQFGLLPSVDPLTLWLGRGRGAYCDGCDAELAADHAEAVLHFADGLVLRLHPSCSEAWLALKGDLIRTAAADLERRATPSLHLAPRVVPSTTRGESR
jgi:hypothetical protein